ncbi:MAG: glycosyltransferase family 4 protein [Deltaproteobacteria bacterium]|nr:glycosyltransferase family 4 protein [Deltaproteobacteria bacterium]
MTEKTKIFASLDDFTPPGGGVGMVGRNMANYYFFCALMRYGTFDEYHFFLSNRAHRNLFREKQDIFLSDPDIASRVRLFDRVDLPDAMKKYDYTVIHQSDHVTHFSSLARLRNRLGVNVPLSAFIHSLSYPAYMPRYLEMHFSGLTEADSIICSSECGKKVVENCLANAQIRGGPVSPVSLAVIPLGIDEPPGPMDWQLARKQLGLKQDEVVGLCFGRFSDFDKMDLFPLLQAFRDVPGEQYRLILAGAVHDREYYQILELWVKALGLSNRVSFVVEPSNEKKLALFSGADFFVSIADNPQETFGLTVLEAMHAGTPVIVSDFDGYRELAGDVAGIRVPTVWTEVPQLSQMESLMDMRTLHRYLAQSLNVDMGALKAALQVMYSDAKARETFGRQARLRFESMFAHARIIKTLETLWTGNKERMRLPSDAETGSDVLEMRIFDTFSHYVSRTLSEGDVLGITDFAAQLLEVNVDYPMLPGMSEVIDKARVREMIQVCQEPCSVAALTAAFGDEWKVQLQIMWMLKHDLLQQV